MPEDTSSKNRGAAPPPATCERILTGRLGSWRGVKISGDETFASLQNINRKIEQFFDPAKAEMPVDILKADHFSSVIRLQAESVDLVIKKEHARSKLEFLTKGFRKSRAAKAWEKGRLLAAKNLDIARPVALIEDFFLFFRTNAYFVCTYLPGTLLRTYLDDPEVADADKKKAAQKTVEMIARWHSLGVTHGDPKASNIIINNNQVYLIDTEDTTCRPPKNQHTRSMARDWAIALHNWQNQPEIRQMALPQILALFDAGQHQLATRLIKKFWKTEPLAAKWPFFKDTDAPPVVKKLTAGQMPRGWEKIPDQPGRINAVCRDTDSRCLFARKAFPSAKHPADYFQKKRLPRRGIFSMALSLRICGFCLPEIIAGGFYGPHEYLLFDTGQLQTLPGILKKHPPDNTESMNLLILLGSEIGRFHAMGFIHGDLSVNTVGLKKSGGNYAIAFLPGTRTRRPGRLSRQKRAKDWYSFKNDLAALLSPEKAAIVITAYEKAYHRQ